MALKHEYGTAFHQFAKNDVIHGGILRRRTLKRTSDFLAYPLHMEVRQNCDYVISMAIDGSFFTMGSTETVLSWNRLQPERTATLRENLVKQPNRFVEIGHCSFSNPYVPYTKNRALIHRDSRNLEDLS